MTTKPQKELYDLVLMLVPTAKLNYQIYNLNREIDIAIIDKKLKIAIEYDASYWHKNSERDKKRQEELELHGWKFIRFVDRVPSLKELEIVLEKVGVDVPNTDIEVKI